jgi:hypothetical protein
VVEWYAEGMRESKAKECASRVRVRVGIGAEGGVAGIDMDFSFWGRGQCDIPR